tara:strand:- start:23793 stop:25091 length:1299 start_codon:yes stop_codon:yes gene_type:complete
MSLRENALNIYTSCLEKLEPKKRVYDYLSSLKTSLVDCDKIFPVAFGKAAFSMMDGLITYLKSTNSTDKIHNLPIVISNSKSLPDYPISEFITAHPTPDENSVLAAKTVLKYTSEINTHDLSINLISGGASSLLCLPHDDISLNDKVLVNNLLLKCGASINEINTIRKHLSKIKGGRLSEHVYPSKSISLIISDVINDDISTIASGPTSIDHTTYSDAIDIIHRYKIEKEIPDNVMDLLKRGKSGLVSESPKNLDNTDNYIICSNKIFRKELIEAANNSGFNSFLIDRDINGVASDEAARLIDDYNSIISNSSSKRIAIISGGETVVDIKGSGKGGRNQELGLSFLHRLNGELLNRNWLFLSVGTDGIDGPTDAAGAIISSDMIDKHAALVSNIDKYLDNNDSYNCLSQLNSLYITGPSGTNVADIQILLVD